MKQSWDEFRQAISAEFAAHPEDFLRQPIIQRTLAPDQPDLARAYIAALRKWPVEYRSQFGDSLLARATEPEYGDPLLAATGYSMVAVQHAWQLAKLWEFLQMTPRAVEYIAEIGAGYGDMCRQIHAGGFKRCYEIFDFREMAHLQGKYLHRCGIKVPILPVTRDNLTIGTRNSLLIATFSVSEMPLFLRAEIEPAFAGYGNLMLSWNESFDGIDNMEWFAGLEERLQQTHAVMTYKDPHMRAWYLFGKKR